jgi:hypothetical protein
MVSLLCAFVGDTAVALFLGKIGDILDSSIFCVLLFDALSS